MILPGLPGGPPWQPPASSDAIVDRLELERAVFWRHGDRVQLYLDELYVRDTVERQQRSAR